MIYLVQLHSPLVELDKCISQRQHGCSKYATLEVLASLHPHYIACVAADIRYQSRISGPLCALDIRQDAQPPTFSISRHFQALIHLPHGSECPMIEDRTES